MDKEIKLPKRLDTANVVSLSEMINASRGADANIDASEVKFVGALGLQLLIAAKRKWRSEGKNFEITAPSEAFIMGCQILGINTSDVGYDSKGTVK